MSNVGIKLKLDASEAVSAANATKDAFLGMAEAMAKATEAGDWDAVGNLAAGMNKVGKAGTGVMGQGGPGDMRNVTPGANALALANQLPGVLSNLGRGDYASVAISGVKQAGSMVQKAGSDIKEDSSMASLAPVLKGIGVAGLVTGALLTGANVLSDQWEKVMEPAMQVGTLLNDTASSVEDGSNKIISAFELAANSANQFSFSATEGLKVVEDLTRYGGSVDKGIYADQDSIFAMERGTGASRSALTTLAGSQARYTGSSAKDTLEASYGGLKASGMEKGQYNEFLTAIQKVFEDGVSKGIVKGTDEISGSLSFFSRMSGNNPLWQGENAAQKYTQMSNATASATSLSSVTDILSYRAAASIAGNVSDEDWKERFGSKKGGDYVDNMLMLEGGISSEMLKAQRDQVSNAEGADNRTGIIERYRSMFGLNYTGSTQLYDMIQDKPDSWFDSKENIKKVKDLAGTPEFKSNEANMLTATETIKTDVSKIGQKFMGAKLGALGPIQSAVEAIRQKLVGTDGLKGKDVVQGAYSQHEESIFGGNFDKKVSSIIDSGLTDENLSEQVKMMGMAQFLKSMTPEDKRSLNYSNALNVGTKEEFYKVVEYLQENGVPFVGGLDQDKIKGTMSTAISNSTNGGLHGQAEGIRQLKEALYPAMGSTSETAEKMKLGLEQRFSSEDQLNNFLQSSEAAEFTSQLRDNANARRPRDPRHSEEELLETFQRALEKFNDPLGKTGLNALIGSLSESVIELTYQMKTGFVFNG